MPYFFFLYQLPLTFDVTSSSRDKVVPINLSANTFIFHKDSLTYFGGNDRTGELCFDLSISNDLTQIVNVPTPLPDCDSQTCSFGFFSSDHSICSTSTFPSEWEFLIMLLSQLSGCTFSSHRLTILTLIGMVFMII